MRTSVVDRKRAAVTAERRAKMRQKMLVAVETLLADEKSYPQISVEQLLRAGGLSRQTFYIYFDDKTDLLVQLVQGVVEDITSASHAFLTLPRNATRGDLLSAVTPVVAELRSHLRLMRALADNAGVDERARTQLVTIVDVASAEFAEAIRSRQSLGALRTSLDADSVARWLVWMAERGFTQLFVDITEDAAQDLIEGLVDIVWQTLYVQE